MQISLDEDHGKYQIQSYEPGLLKINDKVYTHSVIISADTLITDWRPQTITELTNKDLNWVVTQKPEVVILGTGTDLIFPSQEVLAPLAELGLGVEVMNTAAACRTFKVLVAEGRKVVAALIIH